MTRSSENELYEYMHSFILSVMLGSSPLIRLLEVAYIDLRFHLAALSNDWRDLVSRVAIWSVAGQLLKFHCSPVDFTGFVHRLSSFTDELSK